MITEEENTLICFVNYSFPPNINIKWTKNDIEIIVEDHFIKYIPNPDGTFYVFVPKVGEIYGCAHVSCPLQRWMHVLAQSPVCVCILLLFFLILSL